MKYLLIALVILVIAGWLSRGKRMAGSRAPRAGKENARATRTLSVEQIVRCAHCGVHFPASEAVTGSDGVNYCSEAHRRQGARPDISPDRSSS